MSVNSLPKTVTRQHHDCDLNPGPSAPESSTLTTRLHEYMLLIVMWFLQTNIILMSYLRHSFVGWTDMEHAFFLQLCVVEVIVIRGIFIRAIAIERVHPVYLMSASASDDCWLVDDQPLPLIIVSQKFILMLVEHCTYCRFILGLPLAWKCLKFSSWFFNALKSPKILCGSWRNSQNGAVNIWKSPKSVWVDLPLTVQLLINVEYFPFLVVSNSSRSTGCSYEFCGDNPTESIWCWGVNICDNMCYSSNYFK